jgi:glycosyltransferase involved in cell wall biosynthesis
MRILLLTPRLPWPPLDGGRVAMSRLAVSLARGGANVEILSLNPRKHRGVASGPVPIRAIDIDTSRVVEPAMRAIFSETPYIVARFVSRAFREALIETLRRFQPDVVQVESPFLLPYVATIRAHSNAKVVLRSLNVEFRIWESLVRVEARDLRRLALRRVAASLRAYEAAQMKRLDAIVPISDADAADFRNLGASPPMHVVPCGVMPSDVVSESPPTSAVGFIGSLDYIPNQDAVRWILDELWPRVLERAPAAHLSIAGSSPPEWLRRHARDRGVELLADVADAEAFMRGVSVMIAPVFAGGGMRIKVLEAMALGKPVVATTLGAGGIDSKNVFIADDAESFAEIVARLLREPDEAARFGAAARANVTERYDNDMLARGLLRFYESL